MSEIQQFKDGQRDTLFVSYAGPDWAVAEWLALKLVTEGYSVWCDRYKLLGGENWPRTIDRAIETRTFRLIQVLSRHAIDRASPTGERVKALAIGKKLGIEDFYIPLKVDETPDADLPFQTSFIQYIPFQDLGVGYPKLMKKLVSIETPRIAGSDGAGIAASSYYPPESIVKKSESVASNVFRFLNIPADVILFHVGVSSEVGKMRKQWPCARLDVNTYLSFVHPDDQVRSDYSVKQMEVFEWNQMTRLGRKPVEHVLSELLRESVLRRGIALGLGRTPRWKGGMLIPSLTGLFFSYRTLKTDWITFTDFDGRASRMKTHGQTRNYYYRNGFDFKIVRLPDGGWTLVIRVKPYIRQRLGSSSPSDTQDMLIEHTQGIGGPPRSAEVLPSDELKAYKEVTRGWFDEEISRRIAASVSYLSRGTGDVQLNAPGEPTLSVSSSPTRAELILSIDDDYVAQYGRFDSEVIAVEEADDETL